MLIRNARLKGYASPVDLRLMHSAVREIGVGLQKGLYESVLDADGAIITPCRPQELPARCRWRDPVAAGLPADRIVPGTPAPLAKRDEDGTLLALIDEHAAD